ncbi:hypothetical protein [Enterococcus sp. LJL51]|uniref:hypothetical protein n=1 Tax=Enterococcus sp. LJL51 TaxID=3416656 RepID=UPI003CE7155B
MAYHTYEFLKKRRNEPKWRKAYISARNKRIISTLILINLLLWGTVLFIYIQSNNTDISTYIENIKQTIMNTLK